MEKLGAAYGFEIVGYIELTQDYQIEFNGEMEKAELRAEYGETQKPYAEVVNMLAHVEVLQHNRRELQRMMENEEHRQVHPAKSRCI